MSLLLTSLSVYIPALLKRPEGHLTCSMTFVWHLLCRTYSLLFPYSPPADVTSLLAYGSSNVVSSSVFKRELSDLSEIRVNATLSRVCVSVCLCVCHEMMQRNDSKRFEIFRRSLGSFSKPKAGYPMVSLLPP